VSASKSSPVSEAEGDNRVPTAPADPRKNPSYPPRVHVPERARWQAVLRACDERIAPYLQKMTVVGAASPDRARFERLYAQMLGARDQVAVAVKRLPLETGHLYEEDRHRVEEAVAALDRVFKKWDAQTAAL
jgi:hypothetical protein